MQDKHNVHRSKHGVKWANLVSHRSYTKGCRRGKATSGKFVGKTFKVTKAVRKKLIERVGSGAWTWMRLVCCYEDCLIPKEAPTFMRNMAAESKFCMIPTV